MREIEYRGKNKDIGWVYGQLVFDTNKNPYIVKEVEQDSSYGLEETMLYATMWYRVILETVGQYTGLKDKNGVKIYENDILKFLNKYSDDEPVSRSKVYIFNGTPFCIDVETGEYDVTTLAWAMEHNIEDVEVIGNIYDNPELLEGGK